MLAVCDYYFGVRLIHTILWHTDNLSKTLQLTKLSAAEGQDLAKKTVTTLQVRAFICLPLCI